MSAFTAKYAIPTLLSSDPVSSAPTVQAAEANRMDLLLGETGLWTPSMVAATLIATTITLSRTYPGNTGASVPGIVIIMPASTINAGVTLQWWVDTFVGSATTITGFTIHAVSSTTTVRTFMWRFLPCL